VALDEPLDKELGVQREDHILAWPVDDDQFGYLR
jgi:hypothetical protein